VLPRKIVHLKDKLSDTPSPVAVTITEVVVFSANAVELMVPEINPVLESIDSPLGKPKALKLSEPAFAGVSSCNDTMAPSRFA